MADVNLPFAEENGRCIWERNPHKGAKGIHRSETRTRNRKAYTGTEDVAFRLTYGRHTEV